MRSFSASDHSPLALAAGFFAACFAAFDDRSDEGDGAPRLELESVNCS